MVAGGEVEVVGLEEPVPAVAALGTAADCVTIQEEVVAVVGGDVEAELGGGGEREAEAVSGDADVVGVLVGVADPFRGPGGTLVVVGGVCRRRLREDDAGGEGHGMGRYDGNEQSKWARAGWRLRCEGHWRSAHGEAHAVRQETNPQHARDGYRCGSGSARETDEIADYREHGQCAHEEPRVSAATEEGKCPRASPGQNVSEC